jgi:hypothetical protein
VPDEATVAVILVPEFTIKDKTAILFTATLVVVIKLVPTIVKVAPWQTEFGEKEVIVGGARTLIR